jgi:hypothetical protein
VVGTRRRDRLAVLYLESFGNPRKFARTARRVGATLPARLAATRQDRRPAALLRDLVDAEPAQSEDEAVKAAGAMEPIVTGGTEMKTGVTHDRMFGPLVVFGPGDHAARLTPLTDTDADALIRSIDAAPRLLGQRGVPATDLETLRELLLRVSRGLRNGRADQAGALPATGPFSSSAAFTGEPRSKPRVVEKARPDRPGGGRGWGAATVRSGPWM